MAVYKGTYNQQTELQVSYPLQVLRILLKLPITRACVHTSAYVCVKHKHCAGKTLSNCYSHDFWNHLIHMVSVGQSMKFHL